MIGCQANGLVGIFYLRWRRSKRMYSQRLDSRRQLSPRTKRQSKRTCVSSHSWSHSAFPSTSASHISGFLILLSPLPYIPSIPGTIPNVSSPSGGHADNRPSPQ